MKQELLQLPNGEELTREQLIERESYLGSVESPQDCDLYESDEYNCVKRMLHYIGFNVLCFGALLAFALLCPKCSDADDRAIGTDSTPTTTTK